MKKLLVTVLFATAINVIAFAQIRYGVKGGANFASLRINHADAGDEDVSMGTRTGAHGGAFVSLPLSSRFRIQPEVLFSMEGGKYKQENVDYHLTYLQLPVMLQYNAGGFIAETGPQLGLPVSAKAKRSTVSIDMEDEMRSPVFSWGLGAGYRLSNGLGISARYNLGLSHVFEGDTQEGSVRSKVVQIGLFYAAGGRK